MFEVPHGLSRTEREAGEGRAGSFYGERVMSESRIIRVFPRRTSLTPSDDMAFVGDPPMMWPEADQVHISVTFTWDREEGMRLHKAWRQYYQGVLLGGPAFGDRPDGFRPGRYIREGVTFTSRGCNNRCPWCLVPKREGKLREIKGFAAGHLVNDNNLLQCNGLHLDRVFGMLRHERSIEFVGGLDARLLTSEIVDQLRSLRIRQMFFACDTKESIKPLRRAAGLLASFTRHQRRCYVLCAFDPMETVADAEERLEEVWTAGFVPFAQLYQPPGRYIDYPKEWRQLVRKWSRPAAIVACHSL